MMLTALEIKHAKTGMHVDGSGLYLLVSKSGTKSWIYRYTFGGKRREMGLGSVATLPADKARLIALQHKATVGSGIDPLAARQQAEAAQIAQVQAESIKAEAESRTFRVAITHCLEAKSGEWRNAKHRQQWENTLETYACPTIGSTPVQDITVEHVLQILKPIWRTKTETATRVRGRIEAVLDYAKGRKWRTGENPAAWRGNLAALLPKPDKVAKKGHHAALPYAEMKPFMQALREREGLGARALEFAILTAARSGEVRGALWSEINLKTGVWVIPAERMKAGRPHRVPLSQAAVELLEALQRIEDSDLVFLGARHNRPISDMTLTAALRRMERGDLTAHGFRSSFRDWAAEVTHYPSEMAEMALAHTVTNKVEAAYRRGDLFEKRRQMMEDWSAWCGHKHTSNVVDIKMAKAA